MSRWIPLDASIVRSTVWDLDADIRCVWITMLVLANRDGVVESSVPGLAHESRVPLERAQAAVDVFLAPDPYSRTKEHEGRRIEPVDGGWRLLNHAQYQLTARQRATLRQRAHRARSTTSTPPTEPTDRARGERSELDVDVDVDVGGHAVTLGDALSRSVTPGDEARKLEEIRTSVTCTQCGQPWYRKHGTGGRGDFYGHGYGGSSTGCKATCPVEEYADRAAAAAPGRLCAQCGKHEVQDGSEYCAPCLVQGVGQ
jgi:hypothetical protein